MEELARRRIRVAVVEDEKPIQQYLVRMIKEDLSNSCQFDFSVASYDEFMQGHKPHEYNPDVILLDMHLGEGNPNGMRIVDFFRKRKKKIPKILVISTYLNEFVVELNRQSGIVSGCIKKSVILSSNYQFLEAVIQKVTDPDNQEFVVYLDNESSISLVRQVAVRKKRLEYIEKKEVFKVTKLQLQILEGLDKGKNYAEIAQELNRSMHTVRTHGHRLRKKAGVSSTAQLLSKAKDLGLLN